jgi:hypothetical protein
LASNTVYYSTSGVGLSGRTVASNGTSISFPTTGLAAGTWKLFVENTNGTSNTVSLVIN